MSRPRKLPPTHRPLVLVEVKNGVVEVSYTREGRGAPSVHVLDWDVISGGNPLDVLSVPWWVLQKLSTEDLKCLLANLLTGWAEVYPDEPMPASTARFHLRLERLITRRKD